MVTGDFFAAFSIIAETGDEVGSGFSLTHARDRAKLLPFSSAAAQAVVECSANMLAKRSLSNDETVKGYFTCLNLKWVQYKLRTTRVTSRGQYPLQEKVLDYVKLTTYYKVVADSVSTSC